MSPQNIAGFSLQEALISHLARVERWRASGSQGPAEIFIMPKIDAHSISATPQWGPFAPFTIHDFGNKAAVIVPGMLVENLPSLRRRLGQGPSVAFAWHISTHLSSLHDTGGSHGYLHPDHVGLNDNGQLIIRPAFAAKIKPDPDKRASAQASDCWQMGFLMTALGLSPTMDERIGLLLAGLSRDIALIRLQPARAIRQALSAVTARNPEWETKLLADLGSEWGLDQLPSIEDSIIPRIYPNAPRAPVPQRSPSQAYDFNSWDSPFVEKAKGYQAKSALRDALRRNVESGRVLLPPVSPPSQNSRIHLPSPEIDFDAEDEYSAKVEVKAATVAQIKIPLAPSSSPKGIDEESVKSPSPVSTPINPEPSPPKAAESKALAVDLSAPVSVSVDLSGPGMSFQIETPPDLPGAVQSLDSEDFEADSNLDDYAAEFNLPTTVNDLEADGPIEEANDQQLESNDVSNATLESMDSPADSSVEDNEQGSTTEGLQNNTIAIEQTANVDLSQGTDASPAGQEWPVQNQVETDIVGESVSESSDDVTDQVVVSNSEEGVAVADILSPEEDVAAAENSPPEEVLAALDSSTPEEDVAAAVIPTPEEPLEVETVSDHEESLEEAAADSVSIEENIAPRVKLPTPIPPIVDEKEEESVELPNEPQVASIDVNRDDILAAAEDNAMIQLPSFDADDEPNSTLPIDELYDAYGQLDSKQPYFSASSASLQLGPGFQLPAEPEMGAFSNAAESAPNVSDFASAFDGQERVAITVKAQSIEPEWSGEESSEDSVSISSPFESPLDELSEEESESIEDSNEVEECVSVADEPTEEKYVADEPTEEKYVADAGLESMPDPQQEPDVSHVPYQATEPSQSHSSQVAAPKVKEFMDLQDRDGDELLMRRSAAQPKWMGIKGITSDPARETELGSGKWTASGRSLEDLKREMPDTPVRELEIFESEKSYTGLIVVLLILSALAIFWLTNPSESPPTAPIEQSQE